MRSSQFEDVIQNGEADGDAIDSMLRNRYLSIVEKGKAVLLVLDGNGAVSFASNYIKEVIGYDGRELKGRSIYELLDPASAPTFSSAMVAVKANGGRPHALKGFGIFCREKKRHYFDGLIVYSELLTKAPYILYLHDVTERKVREEILEKTNIELDGFVQKATHDLRAPLLSLEGLVNLAENEGIVSNEYLKLMRVSVEKLARYINNVSRQTRSKEQHVVYEEINLPVFIQRIVDSLRFSPMATNMRFEVSVNSNAIVTSEALRLEQILTNLVSNAIKYRDSAKDLSMLEIVTYAFDDNIHLFLRDNGIGIAEDDLERIFMPYHRATDQSEGLGLGLHLVLQAVHKLNGTISVNSALGRGTEFIIQIPNMKATQNALPQ